MYTCGYSIGFVSRTRDGFGITTFCTSTYTHTKKNYACDTKCKSKKNVYVWILYHTHVTDFASQLIICQLLAKIDRQGRHPYINRSFDTYLSLQNRYYTHMYTFPHKSTYKRSRYSHLHRHESVLWCHLMPNQWRLCDTQSTYIHRYESVIWSKSITSMWYTIHTHTWHIHDTYISTIYHSCIGDLKDCCILTISRGHSGGGVGSL